MKDEIKEIDAMIPSITLWEGKVLEGGEIGIYGQGRYTLAVCGHVLTTQELYEFVKALTPYLSDDGAAALHRYLAIGLACLGGDCPCYEAGVQVGYETPRLPLGV